MAPKHGDSQKVIKDGSKLQRWMPKQRARGRPKKNWMEGIKKAMNGRNLKEGQWEDREQWSLGVRQCKKKFQTRR
jgi:hypothetical protein